MRIPVYWINLQDSTERRERLLRQFHEKGILYQRVEAIQHDQPHIGCCLSHIKAIFQAWSDGNDYALICEDDVDFSRGCEVFTNIQQILDTMPRRVQADWDVLQLQYTEPTFLRNLLAHITEHRDLENRVVKGYFMGAVAYLMNRRGMEKFLQTMTRIEPDGTCVVTARLDDPRAKSEELIYRYIDSYVSIFPVLTYVDEPSTVNSAEEYANTTARNNQLATEILTLLQPENYNVKQSLDYYTLEYHLHWFGGDNVRAQECIRDIFG